MKDTLLYFLFFAIFFSSCKTGGKKESKQQSESQENNVETKKPEVFSASDIYGLKKSAIVLIIAYDQNQIPLSQGSGFFVDPTTVVTNFHVI